MTSTINDVLLLFKIMSKLNVQLFIIIYVLIKVILITKKILLHTCSIPFLNYKIINVYLEPFNVSFFLYLFCQTTMNFAIVGEWQWNLALTQD